MRARPLSTMEHIVLGIVWRYEPCTTYAVMGDLSISTSAYYRNRAGTAYPVVARLVEAGLLEYDGEAVGTRKDRLIRCTPAGRQELQSWITSPIPPSDVAFTVDLLRLRMFFAGSVTREQRATFIGDAVEALRLHLRECENAVARFESDADRFRNIAAIGSVHETKARIAWLEEVTPKVLELP
jgi:DNA-binding PadR family transcriptional regulator